MPKMDRDKQIGIGIIVFCLISFLVLGYLGFIPFLSDLMGANNPRNLNVKYSQSDLDSAKAKLGVTITTNSLDSSDSITILNPSPVKTSLNSAELTAFVNYLADNWKDCPVKSLQVLINNDGTLEVSGTILTDRFDGFADAIHMSDSSRNEVKPILTMVKSNPSFYVKCSLAVTNGAVTSSFNTIQIGGVSVPNNEVALFKGYFESFIANISKSPKNMITNLSFENGQMNLEGSFPKEITISTP